MGFTVGSCGQNIRKLNQRLHVPGDYRERPRGACSWGGAAPSCVHLPPSSPASSHGHLEADRRGSHSSSPWGAGSLWLLLPAGMAPWVLVASPIRPAPTEPWLLPSSPLLPHLISGTQKSLCPRNVPSLMPHPVTNSVSSASEMYSRFASTAVHYLKPLTLS